MRTLPEFNTQCHGGRAASVPWICGDTTYYWKNTYGTQYDTIYGAYKKQGERQRFLCAVPDRW
ncbi:hypothetical protein BN3564_20026 [Escherichia coli]|nr:hypothetical protein BN3564_20026 [Escherichia coli]